MRIAALSLAVTAVLFAGCQTTPKTEEKRDDLLLGAESTVLNFKTLDPTMKSFFMSPSL